MATLINCTIENFIEQQYVGEQKIEKAYIGASENVGRANLPERDMQMAALAKYIPLPERVEDIAAQLSTVQNAQDFKMVVAQIVDMYTPRQKGTIVTKPFRDALMPFITDWKPSDDAVYRQCREVVNQM